LPNGSTLLTTASSRRRSSTRDLGAASLDRVEVVMCLEDEFDLQDG